MKMKKKQDLKSIMKQHYECWDSFVKKDGKYDINEMKEINKGYGAFIQNAKTQLEEAKQLQKKIKIEFDV